MPSDSAEEEHVRRAINAKLQEIINLWRDLKERRRAYQRLNQLGSDSSNQELFKTTLFDICIQDGEASLKRQRYGEAVQAYKEALLLRPNDLKAQLNEIWSGFLARPSKIDISLRLNQI